MNMLNTLKYPLLSVLVAMAACDDAQISAESDGLGEVSFRCLGAGCGSPLTNTNVIGGYVAHAWPKAFGEWADNEVGQMKFDTATVPHTGQMRNVTGWNITPDGHLQVMYKKLVSGQWKTVTLKGVNVIGTAFNAVYEPVDAAPFNFTLEVIDAHCEPGKYDPLVTICRYTIVTNATPTDPVGYPMLTLGKYATCLDDDNNGALGPDEKLDVVFAKNTRLDALTPGGHITADESTDLAACLNGAAAHTPWYLNAFYDGLYSPHARALDPSQLDAILHAWTAWFDGASYTEPGHEVWFKDDMNGLFGTSATPAGLLWEGGYGESGQTCRAADGSHRHVPGALAAIQDYDLLPVCTPGDYTQMQATIGVFSLPAQ